MKDKSKVSEFTREVMEQSEVLARDIMGTIGREMRRGDVVEATTITCKKLIVKYGHDPFKGPAYKIGKMLAILCITMHNMLKIEDNGSAFNEGKVKAVRKKFPNTDDHLKGAEEAGNLIVEILGLTAMLGLVECALRLEDLLAMIRSRLRAQTIKSCRPGSRKAAELALELLVEIPDTKKNERVERRLDEYMKECLDYNITFGVRRQEE